MKRRTQSRTKLTKVTQVIVFQSVQCSRQAASGRTRRFSATVESVRACHHRSPELQFGLRFVSNQRESAMLCFHHARAKRMPRLVAKLVPGWSATSKVGGGTTDQPRSEKRVRFDLRKRTICHICVIISQLRMMQTMISATSRLLLASGSSFRTPAETWSPMDSS